MNTYVSTNCLAPAVPLLDRIDAYLAAGLDAIELGAGVDLAADDIDKLPQCSYLVHNYFPPPAEPFVFNLASSEEGLRLRSLDLARAAIVLCEQLGAPFYSMHAGFVTDPQLAENHLVFPSPRAGDKEQGLDRFVQAVAELTVFASEKGVTLLIENNVCSPRHVGKLLLQTGDEFRVFFERLNAGGEDVGLLLDFGHLNVSAATFVFDRLEFIRQLTRWIGGFHVHDNDGAEDSHRPLDDESWVLDVLARRDFADTPLVLECRCLEVGALKAQTELVESARYGC